MASEWATSRGLDLHLEFDGAEGRRAAIVASLQRAIRDGRLPPGARLPSSRALATDLGVARGTVADAYDQLVVEGWLAARRGSGTAVTWTPPRPGRAPRAHAATGDGEAPRFDFRPGSPDVSTFPRRDWMTATRRVLHELPDADLRYGDPRGLGSARDVLAEYVARTRGVRADPSRIVITTGFTQALSILAVALADLGATSVALEDPCIPAYRDVATRAGLRTHALPVDRDGADVTSLVAASGIGAAVLTPAHQYPIGSTLAPARRTAVIGWAREAHGYVVEDDYDGEFRYDRQPVGSLQAMDPDRAIYVGTASKSLAPALRLAWMVVPPSLMDPVVTAKNRADRQTAVLDQATLAELIRSGALDRHVRRSRLRYRRRRDALTAALATVPRVRAEGIAAGLHAVVELTGGQRESEMVDALAAAGVAVHGLEPYWHRRRGASGLVVGFGTPPEHAFPAALAALIAGLR
jgi:GntR family transcriptional regulator/MocR family aminotransferase